MIKRINYCLLFILLGLSLSPAYATDKDIGLRVYEDDIKKVAIEGPLVACSFEGTWAYNDDGNGNDFAVTCRNNQVTGWCGTTPVSRGFHANNYSCENPTAPGIACAFDGTWEYNDQGSGNDFAITCRNGIITGFCGATPAISRGINTGIYSCETPSDGVSCDFNGTWGYNDEGTGNDLALTCHNNLITGFCGNNSVGRGLVNNNYSCESNTSIASPLKIFKDNKTYSVALVDPTDSNALRTHIKTSSGIKALKIFNPTTAANCVNIVTKASTTYVANTTRVYLPSASTRLFLTVFALYDDNEAQQCMDTMKSQLPASARNNVTNLWVSNYGGGNDNQGCSAYAFSSDTSFAPLTNTISTDRVSGINPVVEYNKRFTEVILNPGDYRNMQVSAEPCECVGVSCPVASCSGDCSPDNSSNCTATAASSCVAGQGCEIVTPINCSNGCSNGTCCEIATTTDSSTRPTGASMSCSIYRTVTYTGGCQPTYSCAPVPPACGGTITVENKNGSRDGYGGPWYQFVVTKNGDSGCVATVFGDDINVANSSLAHQFISTATSANGVVSDACANQNITFTSITPIANTMQATYTCSAPSAEWNCSQNVPAPGLCGSWFMCVNSRTNAVNITSRSTGDQTASVMITNATSPITANQVVSLLTPRLQVFEDGVGRTLTRVNVNNATGAAPWNGTYECSSPASPPCGGTLVYSSMGTISATAVGSSPCKGSLGDVPWTTPNKAAAAEQLLSQCLSDNGSSLAGPISWIRSANATGQTAVGVYSCTAPSACGGRIHQDNPTHQDYVYTATSNYSTGTPACTPREMDISAFAFDSRAAADSYLRDCLDAHNLSGTITWDNATSRDGSYTCHAVDPTVPVTTTLTWKSSPYDVLALRGYEKPFNVSVTVAKDTPPNGVIKIGPFRSVNGGSYWSTHYKIIPVGDSLAAHPAINAGTLIDGPSNTDYLGLAAVTAPATPGNYKIAIYSVVYKTDNKTVEVTDLGGYVPFNVK